MKLQQLKSGQYFVSLSKSIVRTKGWQKREVIKIDIDQKGIWS